MRDTPDPGDPVRARLRTVLPGRVPDPSDARGSGGVTPDRHPLSGESAEVSFPVAAAGIGPRAAEAARLAGEGAFGPRPGQDRRAAVLTAFDPGRLGVRALALVGVVVVLVAGVLAWRARPQVEPVAAAVDTPGVARPQPRAAVSGTAVPGPAGASAGRSASTEIVVAVGGKVRKPGLVHLPPGARVADALQAAGGAEPGVDVALLNLARKVVDGELIMVGTTAPLPGGPVPAGAAPAAAPPGPVNLNTATLSELDSLPGVGPVLAQRILDARQARGGFTAVSDLRQVDGIGESRYEQLKDLVTV
ncbi:helix-hairpin-helix domain-containing protein [Krasilnikovia sp. MM14-A1004]|uniref:helix-hairpin-helix domain-containing protein n=1 Tax=Krasilnikovia sp. MM14-A1004 TaxID=3373541 RepID=UPI00399D1D50